jgi:hypothetical protein
LASYLPIEVFGLITLSRGLGVIWRRSDNVRVIKTIIVSVILIAAYIKVVPKPEALHITLAHAVIIFTSMVGALVLTRTVRWKEILELLEPPLRVFRRR